MPTIHHEQFSKPLPKHSYFSKFVTTTKARLASHFRLNFTYLHLAHTLSSFGKDHLNHFLSFNHRQNTGHGNVLQSVRELMSMTEGETPMTPPPPTYVRLDSKICSKICLFHVERRQRRRRRRCHRCSCRQRRL